MRTREVMQGFALPKTVVQPSQASVSKTGGL